MMQPPTGITHHRFSLFRFRSPLLTESLLFSLPAGTEMFHFPAFPPVIGSPRLIADSHVLHRLLVPRHPPCALNNLQTIKEKITENSPHTHTQNRRVHSTASRRCSRPLYSSQTTNHTTTSTRENPQHQHQPVTQTTQRAARKPNSAPQWPHHKPGNMTFHP